MPDPARYDGRRPEPPYEGDRVDVTALVHYAQSLEAEVERLRAALQPFALAARGQRFFPNADEWQQASAVYTNTEPSAHEQSGGEKP